MGTAPAFAASRRWTWSAPGWATWPPPTPPSWPPRPRPSACGSWSRTDAVATAARASFLAAFTAGQGYAADADYSAGSWLIHRTGITRGAAVGHTAWAKRAATHPRVLAALAAGQVSESGGRADLPVDRTSCREKYRDEADERCWPRPPGPGWGWRTWPALFAEMYERARADLPDEDPGREFADREVKLATTFGGAGVLHGDLTAGVRRGGRPRCWTRWPPRPGRTMTGPRSSGTTTRWPRRCAGWPPADLLPERAGQPVKAWAHISLADLLLLDGDSALQEQWTAQVRARWAARRAHAVRDRRERRRLAGRGRRRGDRVRRGDGPDRDRRRQRGRAGGPGPAVRGTGPAPAAATAARPDTTRPGPRSSRP